MWSSTLRNLGMFGTPLHIAVDCGHPQIAICLMEHGMADLNATSTFGRRPIGLARDEAMRQLISDIEESRRTPATNVLSFRILPLRNRRALTKLVLKLRVKVKVKQLLLL